MEKVLTLGDFRLRENRRERLQVEDDEVFLEFDAFALELGVAIMGLFVDPEGGEVRSSESEGMAEADRRRTEGGLEVEGAEEEEVGGLTTTARPREAERAPLPESARDSVLLESWLGLPF